MPVMCFRATDGKVAIWEKPPSGDPMAPFSDPTAYIEYIKFHSDLQYLSSAIYTPGVSVNHALVAGVTGSGYSVSAGSGSSGSSTPITNGQIAVASYELVTHSLGYAPLCYVIYNGQIVSPGTVIDDPENQIRMVSVYSTTSKIFLREVAISSSADLPAVTREYDVIVFREPAADPAARLFDLSASRPMVLGKGKVTEENLPIRRILPGETASFYIPLDRTIDIKNGAIRSISPVGGQSDLGFYNGGFISVEAIEVIF